MKKNESIISLPISILALTICISLDFSALSRGGESYDVQGNLNKVGMVFIGMLSTSNNFRPQGNLSTPLTSINATTNATTPKADNPVVEDVHKASIMYEEPIVLLLCGVMLFAGGLTFRRMYFNGK